MQTVLVRCCGFLRLYLYGILHNGFPAAKTDEAQETVLVESDVT
jgi:hypothetical protein